MSKAIQINRHGGPEVLEFVDVSDRKPAGNEVRIRHSAIGLNFIDVYYRSGIYPAPDGLPMIPGNEGAGEIVEVGPGVADLKEGDRVAYVGPLGAYGEERVIAADRLVKVPDSITLDTAAGMMLKGMTVEYLLCRTYPVTAGDTILFHAAAGGVGLIAGQWAKSLGATVIGTAGSAEKVALAKANGYDHVINYREEDFVARVREITDGRGADVVYDSVGKDTFPGSLSCLKSRGLWVSFGQSSGAIGAVDLGLLSRMGSLFATRPSIFAYTASREDLELSAGRLFDMVASGKVVVDIGQTYPLADASRAHGDLESRKTTGTTVLKP